MLLDGRGRVVEGPLLDNADAPTVVFTTAASRGSAARDAWAAAGVEVCEVAAASEVEAASNTDVGINVDVGGRVGGDTGAGVALGAVLDELGARGVIQLMVEGGGAVLGAFLASECAAQQLRLYVGATALGSTSQRWIQSPLASTISEAPRWTLLDVERLGDDVCLDYALAQDPQE